MKKNREMKKHINKLKFDKEDSMKYLKIKKDFDVTESWLAAAEHAAHVHVQHEEPDPQMAKIPIRGIGRPCL